MSAEHGAERAAKAGLRAEIWHPTESDPMRLNDPRPAKDQSTRFEGFSAQRAAFGPQNSLHSGARRSSSREDGPPSPPRTRTSDTSSGSEASMSVNGSEPVGAANPDSLGAAQALHELSIQQRVARTRNRYGQPVYPAAAPLKRESEALMEDERPPKQLQSAQGQSPGRDSVASPATRRGSLQRPPADPSSRAFRPQSARQQTKNQKASPVRRREQAALVAQRGAEIGQADLQRATPHSLATLANPPEYAALDPDLVLVEPTSRSPDLHALGKPRPSPTPKGQRPVKNISRHADPPPLRWKPLMKSSFGTEYSGMILQPDSSPISEQQLAAEVKGIYDGLVTVETKCIDIDTALAQDAKSPLTMEQYQALIALHRTLLYEHHDFLMATQHPSASDELKGLATKNSMPARMWRHGIHAFLEVLRHRRPDSQDYMLAFVVLSYQMTALLFETVPSFTDTWIECLGDLARYRMAIEDDREMHAVWGGVAARWYTLASDRHPDIGRLYHHLGILERPSMRKLTSYAKSLTCSIPFFNARDSMATFCKPIVQEDHLSKSMTGSPEALLVTFFALVFLSHDASSIDTTASVALEALAQQPSAKTKEFGAQLALAIIAAVFEFGNAHNTVGTIFSAAIGEEHRMTRPSEIALPGSTSSTETPSITTSSASSQVMEFYYICFNTLTRPQNTAKGHTDVLASVHVVLAWFYSLHSLGSKNHPHSSRHDTIRPLMDPEQFSWVGLCQFLNGLCHENPIDEGVFESARQGSFPRPRGNEKFIPLAEDYWMRGLLWVQLYLPKDLLPARTDEIESPLSGRARVQRVQWLGLSLAFRSDYVKYDVHKRLFWTPMPTPPSVAQVDRVDSIASTAARTDFAATSRSTTWATGVSSVPTSPTTTSRSSTTMSTAEDSDGFTMIPRRKSRPQKSYADVAGSAPQKRRQENNTVKVAGIDAHAQ